MENTQVLYEEAKLDLVEIEEHVLQARERLNRLMGVWGGQANWSVPEQLADLPAGEEPIEGIESLAMSQRLDLAATEEEAIAAEGNCGVIDPRTRGRPETACSSRYIGCAG